MQTRAAARRLGLHQTPICRASRCTQTPTHRFLPQTQFVRISTRCRPTIAFLPTSTKTSSPRTYASEPLKHYFAYQGKLLVRYAVISVGLVACTFVIHYMVLEEMRERDYPTPHEWDWRERKAFRDANKWTNPDIQPVAWARAYQCARNLCLAFEDEKRRGKEIPRLHDHEDPNDEVPWEFIPHDISAKSEEWRRGYFDTMMLTAKAAGVVDGWLYAKGDPKKNVWPPHFVIGPSNPRPRPIPSGAPPAPREEDCEVAFPPADRYYLKILATKGLTQRQKMEAALDYASFIESKRRSEGAEALYNLALAEATQGMDQTKLPFNTKTLVFKDNVPAPSQNILDAITAHANFKARSGNTAAALPIYLSLLKTRRSLSSIPPQAPLPKKKKDTRPFWRKILFFFPEPAYPPPPPDGTQPPWRSPEERCQEASLNVYIGEIMYTSSSREDGVAWTREGVDIAEEELRELTNTSTPTDSAKERCRECLKMGLDNWSVMVARLAREEQLRRDAKPGVLAFWSSSSAADDAKGRWDAEHSVVEERTKRTFDIVEEVKQPTKKGIADYFKA